MTIYGESVLLPTPAQFHHIKQMVQTDAITETFAIQVQSCDDKQENSFQVPASLDPILATLLQIYANVFSQPQGLPPPRAHDHGIPLVAGATPLKSRPYRYPHHQKAQIELMVDQMLQAGIIQASKSPFSSSILLVKKKNDITTRKKLFRD